MLRLFALCCICYYVQFASGTYNTHDGYRSHGYQRNSLTSLLCNAFFASEDISFDNLQLHEYGVTNICPIPHIPPSACKTSIKYRRIEGICNNLQYPNRGSAGSRLGRLREPIYVDGKSEPQVKTTDGDPLPDPVVLSKSLLNVQQHPDLGGKLQRELSLMFVALSHYIHSDLVNLAQVRGVNGICIDCCSEVEAPACSLVIKFQISNYGENTGVGCLPYVRLLPGISPGCPTEKRVAKNLATSFLDGSPIYGSSTKTLKRLRLFSNGLMRVTKIEDKDTSLPPLLNAPRFNCRSSEAFCFDGGTQAVNFLPWMASVHGVLLGEHNRIAVALKKFNRYWDDNKLFEEARKILVAQTQHILTSEWLPVLIGEGRARRLGLVPRIKGHTDDYDPNKNPEIFTVYAVATGNFYLTMLVQKKPGGAGELIAALLSDRPAKIAGIDLSLSRNFLLDEYHKSTDIVATIIQMGRDMGLARYVDWRTQCGLKEITGFDDLVEVMGSARVENLKQVYKTVQDIDVTIGMLAELPIPGGLLGPTMACVFEAQWKNIIKGDRFWYENPFRPTGFTLEQLAEIKKASLARLICDNSALKYIQPLALRAPDKNLNCPVPCSSSAIPSLDLSKWTDVEAKFAAPFSREVLETILQEGKDEVIKQKTAEQQALAINPTGTATISLHRSVFLHSRLNRQWPIDRMIHKRSWMLLESTKKLLARFQDKELGLEALGSASVQEVLSSLDVDGILAKLPSSECLKNSVPCDHTANYRTATGWCNNLRFPHYSASHQPFRRLKSPQYDDGISSPRHKSVFGTPLPNPRAISTVSMKTGVRLHEAYSHLLMLWGQFVDHDLSLTPHVTGPDGEALDCTDCDSPKTVSINCLPIEIPNFDPFFPPTTKDGKRRCLGFVRSQIGQYSLGFREQLNALTAYMDASMVYGSDDCDADNKRSKVRGKLRSQFIQGIEEILPRNPDSDECVASSGCFEAGDARVNEHTLLTALHTLLLREHNRIAWRLHQLNPHWDDERLYQETRKIIGGIIQHVSYKEWLPRFIGIRSMDEFGLTLQDSGYFQGYNDSCDAQVSNEFATAGFRLGHTLISGRVKVASADQKEEKLIPLKDLFFDPSALYRKDWTMKYLAGGCSQKLAASDRHFSDQVRDLLFSDKAENFSGLDLVALNIQRGREHGIGSYLHYRKLANLRIPSDFHDLAPDIMTAEAARDFKKVYQSVKDIDLFAGLAAEFPLKGGTIGPTGTFIVAEQFWRAKYCDRMWYEGGSHPGRFTLGQLEELRKVSLASIYCHNLRPLTKIQPNVFNMPDEFLNKPILCEDIPSMDFTPWKETSMVSFVFD